MPQTPEVRGEEKEEMKQEKRVQSRSGREVTPVEELPQTEVESWEGTGTEKGRRGWSEAAMGPRGWFLSSLQDNHGSLLDPSTHSTFPARCDLPLGLQTPPLQSSFPQLSACSNEESYPIIPCLKTGTFTTQTTQPVHGTLLHPPESPDILIPPCLSFCCGPHMEHSPHPLHSLHPSS